MTKNKDGFWHGSGFKTELRPAVITVVVLVVVTSIMSIVLNGGVNWDNIKNWVLYCSYYGFTLSIVNGLAIGVVDRYFSWQANPKKRAIAGVLGQITITLLTLFVLNIILWVFIFGNSWDVVWRPANRGFYLVAIIITVIISLIYHAVYFFREIESEKRRSSQLEKEKVQSELYSLRNHLDPHFLFNSLNVLSGLIEEDKEEAQHFLGSLSTLYRSILEKQGQTLSSLDDELKFAKSYIQLYERRFEGAIKYQVDIPREVRSYFVPSLSLQVLLENAVKHNAFDEKNPLHIQIKKDGDRIVLRNNRRRKELSSHSTKKGLKNIESRYELLGLSGFTVEATEDSFSVALPLIESPEKSKLIEV
ncbi:MAG: hypothetical protein GVX96_04860 [Bacteroidetes bacterium]|jgi:LytS/YehU family sensor histidine kinase|nr:hypothetical protein [Bacteroidota bacterium]